MPSFLSTHRKVISIIHLGFQQRRFAIWEVRDACGVSTSSVTRTLRKLVELRLVRHYPKGYRDRNYEVTKAWDHDVMKNIEVYELAKVLNL